MPKHLHLQRKLLEILVVRNIGVDTLPDDLLCFFAEFLAPLGIFLVDGEDLLDVKLVSMLFFLLFAFRCREPSLNDSE